MVSLLWIRRRDFIARWSWQVKIYECFYLPFIWDVTLHFSAREPIHKTSQFFLLFFFLKNCCHTSLFISVMFEFRVRWRHKAWLNAFVTVLRCHASQWWHTSPVHCILHVNTRLPYISLTARFTMMVWILSSFMHHFGNPGLVVAVSCWCDLCQLSLQYQVHQRRDSVRGHGHPEWQQESYNITISLFFSLQHGIQLFNFIVSAGATME